MAISKHLSIITLNVNGLNSPMKRHRVNEWIRKQDPTVCYLQDTHFGLKDTHRQKVKEWKKDTPCKWKPKESGIAILISDKIEFKEKTLIRDQKVII